MPKFKWVRDNKKHWGMVDQWIIGLGDYMAKYRGDHMKALVDGVWAAYGRVDSEVRLALYLAAAGRDDEAMEWFREALDLFDTSLAAQRNERVSELSTGQMYSLYLASHATYIADWAVAGTNDVQWLGRALRFEQQWLDLEGDERVPDPEKDDIFVSALVEAEDRDAALRGHNLLHPEHSLLESMCALGTPGSLACALMLAEVEADEDARAGVKCTYEDFLARVIRYDKNGLHWPFRQFDFVRFQYLRHKYIERDSPSIFQLIREARGF